MQASVDVVNFKDFEGKTTETLENLIIINYYLETFLDLWWF